MGWKGYIALILAILLTGAAAVVAVDPPHGSFDCSACHSLHGASGAGLTNQPDNATLCIVCHSPAGDASDKPLASSMIAVPGTSGHSHSWESSMPAAPTTADSPYGLVAISELTIPGLRTSAQRYDDLGEGITCGVCHNQHSQAGLPWDPVIMDSGTTDNNGAADGSTVVNSTAGWGVLTGFNVKVTSGTHSGEVRTIQSNTATTLTVSPPFSGQIFGGVTYEIDDDDAWHFMRVSNDLNQLCEDCHRWRTTVNETDTRTYTGNRKSHPIVSNLTSDVTNSARFVGDAPLENNGSTQTGAPRYAGNGSGDAVVTNNIIFDAAGKLRCLSCHGVHYSDSDAATEEDAISVGTGDGNLLKRDQEDTCHGCHKTERNFPGDNDAIKSHNSVATGSSKHPGSGGWGTAGTYLGEIGCTTCHTGHDTSNIYLIKDTIMAPDNSFSRPVIFSDISEKGDDSDAPRLSSSRICEVCHTYDASKANGVNVHAYDQDVVTGHNDHTDCVTCHNHKRSFTVDCLGCHSVNQGNRAAVATQFGLDSHHIQGTTVTTQHCYQCHWEANADGSVNQTYHGGQSSPGSEVDLVIYGAGVRPSTYTPGTSVVLYTADGTRIEIQKINSHCLGCHNDANETTEPFGDGKIPMEYAWDDTSINARYSQTDTTTWGKYDPAGNPGVTPKYNRTKALSAHGNAIANEGGWDLAESWPNNRNGSENIACFDCHNSHGSSVDGPATSYASATTYGGILKDTSAGEGGYSVTYKPVAGGSVANKNVRNAGASLCLDCHLTANGDASQPWGYEGTFGSSQPIIGYFDSEFLAPGLAGPQKRYAYKGLTVNAGGHFGASSPLASTPTKSINGLCAACHDPHGVSPSLGVNKQYGVPMLKGTWLTSPYKEDAAPRNNVPGTVRKEGVGFHIDQGTITGDVIAENENQFAGLCLNCHQKNDLTDGVNGGTWKSVDRIHESVKGWGTNAMHNYSCSKCHTPHNGSALPRLMITNCLDTGHKGRLGNNPSPVTSGYGYGGYYEGCQGDSITAGDCGSGWGDPAYGYGNFPGFWTRLRGLPVDPVTFTPPFLAGCHSDQSADNSWNNVTRWTDDSPAPPQFPELMSEPDAVCSTTNCTTNLGWHASVAPDGDPVEYFVQIDNDADFSSPDYTSGWISVANYSFAAPNDVNGHTWYWRVQARDSLHTTQESIWSSIDSFTVSYELSAPARYAEPDLECGSSCIVTLQWFAVTVIDADPAEYFVEVDNDADFSSPEYDSAGWISGLSFDVTLPTETSWYWRVKARDSVHTAIVSQWSVTDSFNLTARPARPSLIVEPDNHCAPDCAVTLEWNPVTAPDGDPVEYFVQIDSVTSYDSADLQESGWISGTSWAVTVATDERWYWHVQARDAVHTTLISLWSINDWFNVTGNPTAPVLVAEPDIVCPSGACLDITLNWNAVTSLDGDTIEYFVQVDDNSDFSSPEFVTSSWITDIFWDVTVTSGSNWYWRVQARDSVHPGWISSWSTVDNFTIAESNPPPTPVLITEPDYDSTTSLDVNLQWNSVIDPDGDLVEFQVQTDVNTNFNSAYLRDSGWISATDWDVTLVSCWTWYWRVRARDATHPEAVSAWTTLDSFMDISTNCGGSCPFLYVWEGDSFGFGADLYGAGKLAAESSSGFFSPNPNDNYILETEPVIKDGFYEMRLVEERYEVNYLDQLSLYAMDIPADRDVYATKQSFTTTFNGIAEELYTVERNTRTPVSILHVNTGEDVTTKLASSDENIITLSNDRNLDFEYHTLELDLGDLAGVENIKLIIDGVTAFPNNAAGAARSGLFGPRTKLEVLDENGSWVSVSKSVAVLPKPPEFRRPFVFDISNIFQTNDYRVRLTFLFKTYLDSIVVDTTSNESITLKKIKLASAELRSYGHSAQQTLWDDYYEYVYNENSPNHEHDYFPGSYTRFGNVSSLLNGVDDMFVIFGSGDEIVLRFLPIGPPPDGFVRKYLIYTNGYYKDAKVNVVHAVEPLPFSGMSEFPYDESAEQYPDDQEHQQYLSDFNTRNE
jgi:predicted CXXCH cytochrome family protein